MLGGRRIVATQEQTKNDLGKAVIGFIGCIETLSESLKACREAGMTTVDMHDIIMESVPEEDRPAFQQQWPMISMLLSAL